MKNHTYLERVGWDTGGDNLITMQQELKYYQDCVEMGESAFRGGDKARQRVSFKHAIKVLKTKIQQEIKDRKIHE